ncbi:hypothetical protein TSUD_159670 [Trifolium subterraneum]|uniref:RNase H type-1 domain-containing protein n=1 Tax=Trifolium subterraneum TaxID=3900 RepID=A0A2Z6MD42_TRISU|nr:hypothetical protein TSUD_159670 [Trifolium subterraneum]
MGKNPSFKTRGVSPRNFLKLNVDAHAKDAGYWGLGLVLRREDGRGVGAVTKVVKGPNDATLAEANGLLEALNWIKTMQLMRVVIEMDATVIVRAIHRKEFPRSRWGKLVQISSRDFDQGSQISINWVGRNGNRVAHELARWAFSEPNRFCIGERDQVSVSHLQFADDTLLIGVKSWANVRALRAILVLFETMSGLKVNFNKSLLVGVNIFESWLGEVALCCKVGKILFLYLGLPIGGDPRHLGFWEPVLARLKKRLSGWKNRFLSFGGRPVLLKSVLTSLHVYTLSFFKAPSGIISSIEYIFIKKNWGGCEDFRKISWVKWKTICLRKEYGGLRVRQLREFTLALLGKWCWRLLVHTEGLWFRVLAARYGREGVNFEIEGAEVWQWRRQLRAWEEEMLWECQTLLSLQVQSLDRWQWQPGPVIGYTVRGAYQLLTAPNSANVDDVENLIWHPQVPLKVSIFAWRLLRDSISGSIWPLVRSWIGITSADPASLPDHFVQFTYSSGGSRARQSFLQLIWFICAWIVWMERNHRLFRGSTSSTHQLLDKIKLFSFRWLKETSGTLASNPHSWWSSPMLCLGVV